MAFRKFLGAVGIGVCNLHPRTEEHTDGLGGNIRAIVGERECIPGSCCAAHENKAGLCTNHAL